MDFLESTQENIEKALGEAITARSIALDYYTGLGPPDLCCLNKSFVRAWMPPDPGTVPSTGCVCLSSAPRRSAVTPLLLPLGTSIGSSALTAAAQPLCLPTSTLCSAPKRQPHGEPLSFLADLRRGPLTYATLPHISVRRDSAPTPFSFWRSKLPLQLFQHNLQVSYRPRHAPGLTLPPCERTWGNELSPLDRYASGEYKISKATVCVYNAFRRVDVRIVATLPGKVRTYFVDGKGEW